MAVQWRAVRSLVGGIFINLTLGAVYTNGNMVSYYTSYIRAYSRPADMTYADTEWVHGVVIIAQDVGMLVAAICLQIINARLIVLLGCVILSGGVALTGLTIQVSFTFMLFTYGLMVGIGTGLARSIPLAFAMKWLPNNQGLAIGVVDIGMSGSAFIFNQVQTAFINPDNKSPDTPAGDGSTDSYFSPELAGDVLARTPLCFYLLGGVYFTLQLVGCWLMVDPAAQSKTDVQTKERTALLQNKQEPPTDCTEDKVYESISDPLDVPPLSVLRTPVFYILWWMTLLNGMILLFVPTVYKAYGQTFIHDDQFLSVVGSIGSLCQVLGRLTVGHMADRFSIKLTLLCYTGAVITLLLTLSATALGGQVTYCIWISALFFTYSGFSTLNPSIMLKAFGHKYFVVNYGLLCTTQVVAGLLGPVLTTLLLEKLGWTAMFWFIAGLSFIAWLLTFSFDVKTRDGKDI